MKSEIDKALAWAGSRPGLAHRAGVTQRAVDNWVKNGHCPQTAAMLLEVLSKGELKAAKLVKKVKK
jgi:hypothetical protein